MSNITVTTDGDPNTILIRGVGAVVALLYRRRHNWTGVGRRGQGAWDDAMAFFVDQLVSASAGVLPELRGREPLEVLRSGGAVALILRVADVSADRVGRQLQITLLAWSLARLAVQMGAKPTSGETRENRQLLDAAFSPATRRAAHRYLVEHAEDLGLSEIRVDFAACWVKNRVPIVCRSAHTVGSIEDLPPRQFAVVVALGVLILACDCWVLQKNPIDVLCRALAKLGADRWVAASEELRQAIAEGLVDPDRVRRHVDSRPASLCDLGQGRAMPTDDPWRDPQPQP